jgi:hypothetical protein
MPKGVAIAGTDPKSKIGFHPAHLINHEEDLQVWSTQHPNHGVVDVASHAIVVNHQHHHCSLSLAPQATRDYNHTC